MAWNSSLGAELLPDTKAFCPKHSLHQGKGELVINIVPWLYNVERSLSVLWCKCDKGRKEVWTWEKRTQSQQSLLQDLDHCLRAPQARVPGLCLPDSEPSEKSSQEFPGKISERKHSVNKKRKSLGFLVCSQKWKILFDRKQPIECLPNTWNILVCLSYS